MKLPVFKDVFRNYLPLLLPLSVAVVGGLLFVLTHYMLRTELIRQVQTDSLAMGNTIQQYLTRGPVARNQWKAEEDYQSALRNDANRLVILSRQTSQRELLSNRLFPEPGKDSSTLIFEQFGKQFRESVKLMVEKLNAKDCPTKAQIDTIKATYQMRRTFGAYRGASVDITTKIIDELCQSRAKEANVYANYEDLSGYQFWAAYKYAAAKSQEEAIKDCWFWQLGYWIVEDVVKTIAAANAGSPSVYKAPVKRLMRIDFGSGVYGLGLSAAGKPEDSRPAYIISLGTVRTVPCTARVSGSEIDVVHFNISVVLRADAILPFMREICSAKEHKFRGWDGSGPEQTYKHNQITVLDYSIIPVDRGDRAHELYRYGQDAVVQLDLACEYIFDRSGYDEVKPEVVKKAVDEELKKAAPPVPVTVPTLPRPPPKTLDKKGLTDL